MPALLQTRVSWLPEEVGGGDEASVSALPGKSALKSTCAVPLFHRCHADDVVVGELDTITKERAMLAAQHSFELLLQNVQGNNYFGGNSQIPEISKYSSKYLNILLQPK